MNNEQIVNSIRSICKEHNITVTKLEETLSMSQGLISRWNKSDPSLSKIIDIADYFNLSLDDVVGYKNSTDDKFIDKLVSETINNKIKWSNYTNPNEQVKQYFGISIPAFFEKKDTNEYLETHKEVSYFTQINNGYVSIYGFYETDKIKNPIEIKLFIQPDNNSNLIEQKYFKSQLLPLWLKILYSLNEEAPDVIKAEELKHAFISESENSKTNISSIQREYANSILNNQSLIKLIETINTPEFQKIQQTFSNPEFQKAIQTANKMQQNLGIIPLLSNQKED